jgi:acetyl-CoA C-acetyltransferase
METLSRLKPVFKTEGGTVTAGNAPGVNDGAAALVVTSMKRAQELGIKPLVRIVAYATSGIEPSLVMLAPIEAIEKVFKLSGWDRDEVGLYEINEAFSAQALAVIQELKLNPEKVNVNGGAVALGHPIGATGARILTTLLYAMKERNIDKGIAGLCLGGGNAVAMAVERL